MKKIAIFTEGQGELIFVRQLIQKLFDASNVSFECFELRKSFDPIPVPYSVVIPTANLYFQIINVGNDTKVLSAILKRQKKLIESDFEILGLRDMYSREYKKESLEINSSVIDSFIEDINALIQEETSNPDKIHLFFAIMELEAWFLSMYPIFEKISPTLTTKFINSKLGFDLAAIDPEITFFNPAKQVDQIFRLIGKEYGKSKSDMEKIVSKMDDSDILAIVESTKCKSFTAFINKVIEIGQ